ncbi:hypothetical protein EC968_003214 [Mortierella alpina]|nr:hypothetical protein EC968_003214 [Mortierella alpina]
MAPPKRSPALTDSAANFFQRGRKPTTAQRVVTVKKSAAAPIALKTRSKLEDEEDEVTDEIENDDSEEEGFHQSDEDDERAGDEDEEDHGVVDDTILSDDSDVPVTDMKKTAAVESRLKKDSASQKATERVPTKAAKGTRARGNRKSPTEATYVAPYVGDIYVGFHQAELSDAEKILRQFDLASKYGPCTDVTRLDRWERAFNLGLDPPQHVKDIIVQHEATRNIPLFEGRV